MAGGGRRGSDRARVDLRHRRYGIGLGPGRPLPGHQVLAQLQRRDHDRPSAGVVPEVEAVLRMAALRQRARHPQSEVRRYGHGHLGHPHRELPEALLRGHPGGRPRRARSLAVPVRPQADDPDRAQLRCEHHHDHQAAPHHHDHRGSPRTTTTKPPHTTTTTKPPTTTTKAPHTPTTETPTSELPFTSTSAAAVVAAASASTTVHGGRRPVAVHRRRHTTGRLCRRGPDHARLLHSDHARAAATSNAADGLFDADELGRGNGHPHHPMVPGRLSRGRCHSCGAAG